MATTRRDARVTGAGEDLVGVVSEVRVCVDPAWPKSPSI
jgi:hypothetical protein